MAPTKFINFLAIVSFAVFFISLTPIPANALVVERAHVARNVNHAHAGIAKKKREDSPKRCKPRSSSTHSSGSTSSTHKPPKATPTQHSSSSTTKPPPHTSPSIQHSPSPTSTPPVPSSSHKSAATSDASTGGNLLLGWSNDHEGSFCEWGVTFAFNWQMNKYPGVDINCTMIYIAVVWGRDQVKDVPTTLVEGYAKYVSFTNEAEIKTQADMTVAEAVPLFMQYINPLKNIGYKIISSCNTNSQQGLDWVTSFVKQIRSQGGTIDILCVHAYTTDVNYFISYLENFMKVFSGDPIWIMEMAAMDYNGGAQLDDEGVRNFLQLTFDWMKGQKQIQKISWFGAFTRSEIVKTGVTPANSLMNDDGTPSPLGELYLSY